jgi:hypothetical protein
MFFCDGYAIIIKLLWKAKRDFWQQMIRNFTFIEDSWLNKEDN